jgi:hypothetical protein
LLRSITPAAGPTTLSPPSSSPACACPTHAHAGAPGIHSGTVWRDVDGDGAMIGRAGAGR